MAKPAGLLIALLAASGLLWLAGEQHRENCIREDRTGCSVLPWDHGDDARSGIDLTQPKSAREVLERLYGD